MDDVVQQGRHELMHRCIGEGPVVAQAFITSSTPRGPNNSGIKKKMRWRLKYSCLQTGLIITEELGEWARQGRFNNSILEQYFFKWPPGREPQQWVGSFKRNGRRWQLWRVNRPVNEKRRGSGHVMTHTVKRQTGTFKDIILRVCVFCLLRT